MKPSAKAIENFNCGMIRHNYSILQDNVLFNTLEDYEDKRVWKWFESHDFFPCCDHCKGKDYTGFGSNYDDFESKYDDYILIRGLKCYNCKLYLCQSCYEEKWPDCSFAPPSDEDSDEDSEAESKEEPK